MTHTIHPHTRRIVKKVFWEIGIYEVDRTQTHGCKTMVGNRGMHQVMCFIKMCLLDNFLLGNRLFK